MPFRTQCLEILAVTFLITGCGTTAGSALPLPTHAMTPVTASSSKTPSPTMTNRSMMRVTPAMAAHASMTAIDFTNRQRGWIAGSDQIWRTTDGGTQWSSVYAGPANFSGIQFAGPKTGWVWSHHTIMGTTDGGRTWNRLDKEPQNIITIDMVSLQNGYAVFGNTSQALTLYVTHDAGRQWKRLASPFTPLTVAFVTPQKGWAVSHRQVWKTVDGGKVWTPSDTFASPLPMAARIRLGGTHTVWVMLVGGSGMTQTSYTVLSHTTGQGWTVRAAKSTAGAGPAPDANSSASDGPGLAPGPLVAVHRDIAYLAGESPSTGFGATSIWSTHNQGAVWTQNPPIYGLNGIPGPRSLSFATARVGWLVTGTDNTQVFQTLDSGATWHQIFPPSPAPVQSVTFVNTNLAYGLGEPGHPNTVLISHDGGQHWSKIGRLTTTRGWQTDTSRPSIAFTSSESGWVVRNNHLWHSQDGGSQWSLVTLPHLTSLDVLDFVAFVGRDGVVGSPNSHRSWWTTNGGTQWHYAQNQNTRQTLATVNTAINHEANRLGQPLRFAGSHGQVLWIVFENKTWALSKNYGAAWTTHRFPSNISSLIGNLSFVNAQDGWFETDAGTLFATTNGGRSWHPVYSGATSGTGIP